MQVLLVFSPYEADDYGFITNLSFYLLPQISKNSVSGTRQRTSKQMTVRQYVYENIDVPFQSWTVGPAGWDWVRSSPPRTRPCGQRARRRVGGPLWRPPAAARGRGRHELLVTPGAIWRPARATCPPPVGSTWRSLPLHHTGGGAWGWG